VLPSALKLDDPELVGPPSDQLPSRDEFGKLVGKGDSKTLGLLRVLLAKLAPDATLVDQLVTVEQLGRFVVAGPSVKAIEIHPTLVRLELLILALENVPAARRRFAGTISSVLSQTRAVKLLGEIGLPNDRGLLAETTDRLARRFLPEPPAIHELWALANRIFRSKDDLAWLGVSADPYLQRLATVSSSAWDPIRSSVLDAISLITTRIAGLGMQEAFRTRTEAGAIRESPLYLMTRAQPTHMPALIAASRKHLDQVREHLEDSGVSINVVYAIDSIERGLERVEALLPFVDANDEIEPTVEIRNLLETLGRGLVGGRSFMQLLSDNMRLLARKVIERAGRTGEHYVTSSRREYWHMLATAAGGGVLTTGTAIMKWLVKWGHFAPFIDGLLSSVVYAGSFLVMQLLGFTLATKQPSMTAAALAGTIRDRKGPGQLDELVRLIARIARSQFAAAVGNVTACIATTLLVDQLIVLVTGHNFLDAKASASTIDSFHPIYSGTILFAAFTGVLLWVSSLFAGWFENWIVYRRLPEAIEHHRFGKQIGKARMAKWARFLERHASGFGGSIALGFLLGLVPVFAKFFGLPLDVRHITLSSASLTFSMSSLGMDAVGWSHFLAAASGIAIIGLMNFGVSFALALVVALRARDVSGNERLRLPAAVFKRFLRRPLEFFYPPKDNDPRQSGVHTVPPTH